MAAALDADGHRVDAAPNDSVALDAVARVRHDLLLLDIALGAGPDGIDVCRSVRRVDADVYVMMLTARDAEADVVRALEAGADDYVTKPVGLAELRSRVRAALRRLRRQTEATANGEATGPLRLGPLAVDPAARSVRVGDRPVTLTRSEFAVLEALLRADGAVRSRAELLQAIYGDDAYRDPRGVDVHVHHVRDKLVRAGGAAGWLVTVRGAGYRIER